MSKIDDFNVTYPRKIGYSNVQKYMDMFRKIQKENPAGFIYDLNKLDAVQPEELKAIEREIDKVAEHFQKMSEINIICEMAKRFLTERKHGKWIEKGTNEDGTHNIVCSICSQGYKSKGHAHSYNTKEKFKYCPKCGSWMEVQDES